MLRQFLLLCNIILVLLPIHGMAQSAICEEGKNGHTVKLKRGDEDKLMSICACDHLVTLVLIHLQTSTLPPCLSEKKNLRELRLIGPSWLVMPDMIADMKGLEILEVSESSLHIIPEWLAKMPNLHTIILQGTDVSTLPIGLDHLHKIDLRNIEINRNQQRAIRAQYPKVKIFFSSPCHCN